MQLKNSRWKSNFRPNQHLIGYEKVLEDCINCLLESQKERLYLVCQ